MSKAGKVFAVAALVALGWVMAPVTEAQMPIRVGASLSLTEIAHKMLLFQWQDSQKVIVWPEELAPGKPRFPTPPWSQRP